MPRLITRENIKIWVSRYDSKGDIPLLLSRLVRAIAEKDTYIEFPSGSAVYLPGWDGKTNSATGNEYIPQGLALWEIGTEAGFKGKADRDYKKRTTDPLGYNPSECTFIFVTPHDWNDKDEWIQSKLAEGIWKDVRVYDVKDIELWLDLAPAVEQWLSILLQVAQPDGLQSCEDYWHEWSAWQGGQLQPELVTCGREAEMQVLTEFLLGGVGIRAVKAATKDEAIAFVIATILQMDEGPKEGIISRGLIVEREDVFRSLSNNFARRKSLLFISRFQDPQRLYRAVTDGHHVIYPMGGDDTFSNEIITLPELGRDAHLALEKSGIEGEQARDFVAKSGRNLTLLKRILGFPQNKADWAKPENIDKLIPALFLGRWEESVKGDADLLKELLGEDLEKRHEFFFQLTKSEIPFLYNFGTSWRLASPMDAWFNLASYLKKVDFDLLANIAVKVLSEKNPALELEPSQRELASVYGKRWQYSGWIKEGVVQSLILVAVYGDQINLNHGFATSQLWVDNVIDKIIGTTAIEMWMSLNSILPMIAEASPENFIINLSKLINTPDVHKLFIEDPGTITPRTYYTGLLWSLEEIAWLPEYLSPATILLAKLASCDPGGTLINRPINSLREIYLTWHPQTFATVEQRKEVINELAELQPEIAWSLILKLLPTHHEVAHGTYKLRWRLFNFPRKVEDISQKAWDNQILFYVNKLLGLTNYEEQKVSELLHASLALPKELRLKVIVFIEDSRDKINHEANVLWHEIRGIVPRHREYIDEDWTLDLDELNKLEKLYEELTPINLEDRVLWIFNDRWPKFFDAVEDSDISHDERWKIVEEKKQSAANGLYNDVGVDRIIQLFAKVKDPWALGFSIAPSIIDENEIQKVLSDANLSDTGLVSALQGFTFKKHADNGMTWLEFYILQSQKQGFSDISIANMLLAIPFKKELFDFIEQLGINISNEYWKLANHPTYWISTQDKIYVVEKLRSVNRNVAAIDVIEEAKGDMPADLIVEVLETALQIENADDRRLDQHHVQSIFENLAERQDIDKSRLAKLEWLYLRLLIGYSHSPVRIPLLNEELGKDPSFFIEIIKILYRPATPPLEEVELTPEEIQHKQFLAENAYRLLSAWNSIPGSNDDGRIDKERLWNWLNTVRELAKTADRIDVVDMHIGQVFARQKQSDQNQWPSGEICEVIDTINSDALNRNFKSAIFNKHGSYSKAMFEGGERERKLAALYGNFARKISYKWPITSSILKSLSDRFSQDAKREDEDAAKESLDY